MTTLNTTGDNGMRRTIRRAAVRTALVACALVMSAVAVRGLEAMLNATFDKPRAELRWPLRKIATELGQPVRYTATGSDEALDAEMVETLGTTEYLVRRYVDKAIPLGTPGSLVNLNVNYYGTGTSTPHVPEVCWKGSGRVEAANSRVAFMVKGVKRRDGSIIDLPMRMISFVPAGGPTSNESGEPIYSNVAYVFHVNGEYVTGSQEVTSRFWKASYRFAYHAKIEVTPLDAADPTKASVLTCTQAEAQKIVGDFVREVLPDVEMCLPDPAILTGEPAATSEANSR
jgi:hypothetical protein